ncbi:MAG: hypothetical protein HY749_08595 [Gammaproteobacteria bacterium]|nr:hypothetical protein [Gammaproteobacteria bacterium]
MDFTLKYRPPLEPRVIAAFTSSMARLKAHSIRWIGAQFVDGEKSFEVETCEDGGCVIHKFVRDDKGFVLFESLPIFY